MIRLVLSAVCKYSMHCRIISLGRPSHPLDEKVEIVRDVLPVICDCK